MKSIDKSPTFVLFHLLSVLVLILASMNLAAGNTEATYFYDTRCPVQLSPHKWQDAKVYDRNVRQVST